MMITVIADDLTGAAEIVGVCLRYGIEVSFGIDKVPKKATSVSVIATDTRSAKESEAYKMHQNLVKQVIQGDKNQIVFKKCDSVLRGHVLTELLALMEVTGQSKALLQPANPRGNRLIKNGMYYVDGAEIKETGFANDPDFPALSASVRDLLLRKRKDCTIDIFTETLNIKGTKGVFVPDCTNEADLEQVMQFYNRSFAIGGSAAFFEQFLIEKYLVSKKQAQPKFSFSENYMLVSGSTHPNSIAFAEKLQQDNCPVFMFPDTLLKEGIQENVLNGWIDSIEKVYRASKKGVLRISNRVIQFDNSSLILKQRMSTAVKVLFEALSVRELFIEGGASAYDILKTMQWNDFTPIAELTSGVVRMRCNNDENIHITIKPGSYQWPDGLLR